MTQGVVGAGYRFERSIRDEPLLKAGRGVVEQVEQGVGRVGRPGILPDARSLQRDADRDVPDVQGQHHHAVRGSANPPQDRKSTRLNSSHLVISYAVFCLKKKNNKVHAHRFCSAYAGLVATLPDHASYIAPARMTQLRPGPDRLPELAYQTDGLLAPLS